MPSHKRKKSQSIPALIITIISLVLLVLISIGVITVRSGYIRASSGYLHTSGSRILDSNNNPVTITGINWFGLETPNFAPHGLWQRGYRDMLDQTKRMGFTTLRIPYSNQAFDDASTPSGIDFSKNPDLRGLKPVEILDKIIEYSGSIGLSVILDRHRPDAGGQSALWYTGTYSEIRWLADWLMLANRYKNNPTVIGFDLHNEPHDNACWGCGSDATDWRKAAQKAGNAILKINPDVLIIVEGVQNTENSSYWWGGNLMGVKKYPITLDVPNKLVYSAHDYPASLFAHPWFNEPNFPANMPAIWDKYWGYVINENIAPVLVGEFGTRLQSQSDQIWLPKIMEYMSNKNVPWTFWSLNPNSGDTGGILLDDWETIDQKKLSVLFANYPKPTITIGPVPPTPTPKLNDTATPTPVILLTNTPTPRGQVQYTNLSSTTNKPGPAFFTYTYTGPQATQHIDLSLSPDMEPGTYLDFAYGAESPLVAPERSRTWGAYDCGKTLYWWVRTGNFYDALQNKIPHSSIQKATVNCPQTATPTPTPKPQTNSAITIWWPENNVHVSGDQPFKALLPDRNVSEYEMFWSVDNGQWNYMGDNYNPSPHKEALVNLTDWRWNSSHTYRVEFHAKLKWEGTTLHRSVYIFVP